MKSGPRFSNTTLFTKRGRPMPRKGEYVPRIDDSFSDTAIYLYASRADAEAGSDIGGSGFLVGVPVDGSPDRSWVIAVTNRHNIEQGATFVRVNNKTGSTAIYEIPANEWFFHPDDQDLAIAPTRMHEDFQKYRFVGMDALVTKEKVAELDIGIGTDTFLVGRFVGSDGGQTNIPTVRFGNLAQMPTIILNEFKQAQESFIIESRSISGFSGSPVFAFKKSFEMKIGGPSTTTDNSYWGPVLLGINWGHAGSVGCVFDARGDELEMYVESNAGLAFATPAWRLLELLNSSSFRDKLRGTPAQVGDVDLNLPPELNLWG